jgi:hypothetical protein
MKTLFAVPPVGLTFQAPLSDANIVTDTAKLLQLTIGDNYSVLAQDGNLATVGAHTTFFISGSSKFSQDTSRLHFEQYGTIFGT